MNTSNVKYGRLMKRDLTARPLTSDNWQDFEMVMGPQGGCYGCWCTHFRLPPKERQSMSSTDRKTYMAKRVDAGPPPGLIVYLDGVPAGWVQVTPRRDVPRWNGARTVSRPVSEADADDPAVWSISCFFLQSRFRGQGLSHHMLSEAVMFARSNGASVVEACPMTHAKHSKSVGLFVGAESIFRKYGFQNVACRKEGRPFMRYSFQEPHQDS